MKINNHIKFKDSEQTGVISKILGKGKLEIVLDNGFTVQVKENQVDLIDTPVEEKQSCLKRHRVFIPPHKVDLHIEHLVNDHSHMTNAERIQIQIEAFEYNMDAAIAAGMLEITFIHGIGQGILRKEIHALLKKNKHVKSYMDAQYDRGATLVKIY